MVSGLLSSCIMEERDGCPSYLSIDFSGTPEEVKSIILLLRYEDGFCIMDTVLREDYANPYEIPVRRGTPFVSAFGNVDKMVFDDGFSIIRGEESDKIYTDFRKGCYNGDLSHDTIKLGKSYIGLYIRVMNPAEASCSVEITTECSSIGYSYSGEILEGIFRHTPEPHHIPTAEEGYYEFLSRIVRQKNGDAVLRIKSVQNGAEEEILEIPLSEKLKAAGMDMGSKDLQDIFITINYSRSSMKISVDDWERTEHIEIEI